MLRLPLQFCLKHFLLQEELSEMLPKMYSVLRVKYRYYCQNLMKLIFCIDFEKKIVKFEENPFSGSGVVPRGRTDRHEDANSRFSQFC
jgi:hypothetical protein